MALHTGNKQTQQSVNESTRASFALAKAVLTNCCDENDANVPCGAQLWLKRGPPNAKLITGTLVVKIVGVIRKVPIEKHFGCW